MAMGKQDPWEWMTQRMIDYLVKLYGEKSGDVKLSSMIDPLTKELLVCVHIPPYFKKRYSIPGMAVMGCDVSERAELISSICEDIVSNMNAVFSTKIEHIISGVGE